MGKTNNKTHHKVMETINTIDKKNSNKTLTATLNEITELYFRGGNLNEILKVAKEEGYGKEYIRVYIMQCSENGKEYIRVV